MLVQRAFDDIMSYDCQSVPALDVPFLTSDLSMQDDEMLSWLQYPVDDIFDRTFCSDSIGGLVNTNPHVHLVKDAFLHQNMKKSETTITKHNDDNLNDGTLTCTNAEEEEEEEEEEKEEAGVLQQPPSVCKIQNTVKDTNPLTAHKKSLNEPTKSSSIQTIKVSSHQAHASSFPQFSRPVAATLDSLRLIGAVGGPTNIERARKPPVKNLVSPFEPHNSDINCTAKGQNETCKLQQDADVVSTLLDKAQSKQDDHKHVEEIDITEDITCLSDSANAPSVSRLGAKDRVEVTSSPSYNTDSKASDEDKKKCSPSEEPEITDNPSANTKSGASNARTSKRNRSAESHNESEKKRRNRINLRLKALQELIPNSNKIDKASVLDEAIEYTKMLQAQIQLMSMRTGLFIPPMMMPAGLQYLPVQQIPVMPQMGMGMMNVKSASAGAVQTTMPFPPIPAQSPPIHVYPGPHVSPSIVHASSSCLPIPPGSTIIPSQPPPQNALIQQK